MAANRKKRLIIMLLSIFIFVGGVITTVVLNRKLAEQDIDESAIKEVVCVVTDVKKTVVKVNGSESEFYTVSAQYEGRDYKIKNVSSYDHFSEGDVARVLYYKGKLYANRQGIESSTNLATVYFVFLFGSFAMLFVMINAISKYRRSKWDPET